MAAGCAIGVDLGGTKLLAGVVDAALEVHHRVLRAAPTRDSNAVIAAIVEAVEEAREEAAEDVVAVGVGVPALVDVRTGSVLSSNHLPLTDLPLRDLLAERLGVPVVVDNDVNAALLAEWRHGAAHGVAHALMLTVGTGIGGAAVVDGRLLRGAHGAAAEMGHITVEIDGPPCPGGCPNNGCLESLVSGHAIGREGRRVAAAAPESMLGQAFAAGREITGALVTELAHDGDAAARDVIALIGQRLGVGIASLANVFDPEVVVIGGGGIGAGELLLAPAREEVVRRALVPARDVAIVPARFGVEAGMLGAAAMALGLAAPGRGPRVGRR